MFHIAQRDSSAGALCCREKYYSATSSIVLGKYGIKYKCYPLISKKVSLNKTTKHNFFLCLSLANYDKKINNSPCWNYFYLELNQVLVFIFNWNIDLLTAKSYKE